MLNDYENDLLFESAVIMIAFLCGAVVLTAPLWMGA